MQFLAFIYVLKLFIPILVLVDRYFALFALLTVLFRKVGVSCSVNVSHISDTINDVINNLYVGIATIRPRLHRTGHVYVNVFSFVNNTNAGNQYLDDFLALASFFWLKPLCLLACL